MKFKLKNFHVAIIAITLYGVYSQVDASVFNKLVRSEETLIYSRPKALPTNIQNDKNYVNEVGVYLMRGSAAAGLPRNTISSLTTNHTSSNLIYSKGTLKDLQAGKDSIITQRGYYHRYSGMQHAWIVLDNKYTNSKGQKIDNDMIRSNSIDVGGTSSP